MTDAGESSDIGRWLKNPSCGPENECTPFSHDEIDRPIAARFERMVACDPAKLAVDEGRRTWTYDSLNRHANRAARAILAAPPPANKLVALFLGHGYPQIAGILASLKAGGAYVPLSPSDPVARSTYMIEDCEAGIIITDDANVPAARALSGGNIVLVNLDSLSPSLDDADLRVQVAPDSPGAVYYTSGSEGQPKGVMYSHRNLAHHAWSTMHEFRVCVKDRLAGATHFPTVVASAGILRGLLAGATLCPYDVHTQGIAPLARWLAEMRITIFRSSPTLFRNLVTTLSGSEDFSNLRIYSLGGETVQKQDVELFQRHFPDTCLLRVALGATEAAGGVSYLYLGKRTQILGPGVPVGYPAPDVDVMIVDETGRDVGVGPVGEVVIRSRYLSQGYWRRPDLTAERFSSDSNDPGVRTLRTGDLAHRLSDGCLVHVGRTDSFVKVRGQRVELPEVEAALLDVQGVCQAAVTVRPDSFGDQRLAAYVVTQKGISLTVSQIVASLSKRLPPYMVPAAFVFMPALPTMPNGKLDRSALPDLTTERPPLDADFCADRNAIETRLRMLWEEVLDIHPIGVRDNFFELGGHSLSAARLMAAIEKEFCKSLPITALLESPTIEALAGRISDGEWEAPRSPVVELQKPGKLHPLFCIEAKNAGLFVHLARCLGLEQPVYGLHPVMQPGRISVESLAESYVTEVRRIQPEGPYQLCGLCVGGTIAFEMALQLQAAGETIAFLGLIDSFVPRRRILPASFRRLLMRLRTRSARRAAKRARLSAAIVHTPSVEMKYIRQMRDYSRTLSKASRKAIRRYRPGKYKGRLFLFMAETTNITAEQGERAAWSKHASDGAAIYTIPGMHQEVLRHPHVTVLASHVRRHLLAQA